jgi:hypothetical protein
VNRTPVNVVTGATPDDRKTLIARLLVARPGWRELVPRGCPCCAGRVETQVALARLVREAGPERVLLELADEQHLRPLRRSLGEWPLSRYVEPGRVIRLPEDGALAPEALSA